MQHALATHNLASEHRTCVVSHVHHPSHLQFAVELNLGMGGQVRLAIARALGFFVIQGGPDPFPAIFFSDGFGVNVEQTQVVERDGLPLGAGIGH